MLTLKIATNIKAVDLHAKLAEGKGKVAVMCDPATVSLPMASAAPSRTTSLTSTQVTSDVGFKCIDGTYSPT